MFSDDVSFFWLVFIQLRPDTQTGHISVRDVWVKTLDQNKHGKCVSISLLLFPS